MTEVLASRSRRSIRLAGFDYSKEGAYFVTICAHHKQCLFGRAVGAEMRLNALGEIVREEWLRSAQVRPGVQLDAFVIMPNHLHGIIILTVGATRRVAPTDMGPGGLSGATRRVAPAGPPPGSLGAILGQIKSIAAKRINAVRGIPGAPVWQRNYYEHIIRNERDWEETRWYITDNPRRWEYDRDNPLAIADAHRGGDPPGRPETPAHPRRGDPPGRPYDRWGHP